MVFEGKKFVPLELYQKFKLNLPKKIIKIFILPQYFAWDIEMKQLQHLKHKILNKMYSVHAADQLLLLLLPFIYTPYWKEKRGIFTL